MLNILPDSSKFSQIYITNEKKLNYLGNIELQIIDLLKQLIDFQVNSKHEKLKPRGSRFGILYGLCKIQKSLIDIVHLFGPFFQLSKLHILLQPNI